MKAYNVLYGFAFIFFFAGAGMSVMYELLWVIPTATGVILFLIGLNLMKKEMSMAHECYYNCPYCRYFNQMNAEEAKQKKEKR